MKKRITALVLLAVFLWVCSPEAFPSQVLNIDLPEAYLLEGPGAGYRILCKITRDEALTVLSWEGDWFRVKRPNGMIGWLNRVTLSPDDSASYPGGGRESVPITSKTENPVPSEGSFLDRIRTGFKGGRDDTLTASAGGRGIITEMDSGTYTQDYWAVHYMESIIISDNELNRFIVSGGLRP
jgi:uncharacterized protein YgiM (DUF1202 family)